MGNCETCKFWEQSVTPQEGGFRKCNRIDLKGYREPDPEAVDYGSAAYTEDGSDYRADLFTLPTFGCTEHQPK